MTTLELLGNQLVIRLSTALSLSLGVALLLLVIAVTVLAELKQAVQQYKQSAAVTKLECILVMLIAVMLFMQLNTTSSTTS